MKRWEISSWIKAVVITGIIFGLMILIPLLIKKDWDNPINLIIPICYIINIPISFVYTVMQRSDWVKIFKWLGLNGSIFQ